VPQGGDKYEPDNSMASASTITFDEPTPSQRHAILPAGDVDFIKFYADPNHGYNIEVPAASAFPLKLTLFDAQGNELRSDDQGSSHFIARIGEWTPTIAGWYYIKVEAKNVGGEGYYRIFFGQWT